MIRLTGVSKKYVSSHSSNSENTKSDEIVHALQSISLEVERGTFVAVMGPSGCGKSTLLHITGGLDTPSSGEVWVHDHPIHRMNERQLSLFRRQYVGVIFQFFNLLPQLTALENVSLPLKLLGIPTVETRTRAITLLKEVGLQGKSDRLPAELSGGEQQRVAIARALIHHPLVLLADEPTGNLDSAASVTVLSLLKEMQRSHQATLLLVTHSQEVSRAAHRIVTMQDGQIALQTKEVSASQ